MQIHDFNPGIEDNGLFWVSRVPEQSIEVGPGSGRASMRVPELASRDFGDIVNALQEGPSVPAIVSFDIRWTASRDAHQFHYEPDRWDANVVFNDAQASWQGDGCGDVRLRSRLDVVQPVRRGRPRAQRRVLPERLIMPNTPGLPARR